ncbi:DNA-binding response regulator [Lacihabitans sp. LS3-19]|uniref:LytR/AlgR family response regulator transcription factor n=1 Tax=Lacihabitans sp. LS3-19 TaxID=2487335 RepID=UPI0020CCAD8C|nr:response regulator [Lacihabitans sp. LS3-19]MCP9767178.1 DNA-binding response regulator [Lacihabitans sp. LS3-19]
MVKILLVEDEGIIAADMENMLSKMGYDVLETAMDYDEAIEILEVETPDLILLDVNLGGKKDGIDLAEVINERFKIPFIFTTSYSDGPTIERAKKVNPTNYLVKPFKQEQLFTAIEMALFIISKKTEEDTKPEESDNLVIKDALFIKDKYRYTKLPLSEILWIKAEGNYVEIHLADRKEIIRNSLSLFLEKLKKQNFFRTHKSFAVNLDYLTRFEPTVVYILNTEIPISKKYAEELVKRLEVM